MGFAAKVVAGIDARMREVLYAGLIALVLLIGMVAEPVDQLVWTVQSRIPTSPTGAGCWRERWTGWRKPMSSASTSTWCSRAAPIRQSTPNCTRR
jgi:hypothetical protein